MRALIAIDATAQTGNLTMLRLVHTCALALIVALFATACGGGGGSSGTDPAVAGAVPVPVADPNNPGAPPPPVAGPVTPGPGGIDGETAFVQTVYPLVDQYCVQCHAGAGPGFPHIAHPDMGTAYRAVVDNQKVNFGNPNGSRLVQRLENDRHFCWNDCPADGAIMEQAVVDWATLIAGPGGNPANPGGGVINTGGAGAILPNGIITSALQTLASATLTDSNRYEGNVIAFWDFKEETGTTAFDTSPIGPSMDLDLMGSVSWIPGGGIDIASGKATSNPTDSRKLWNLIASGTGSQEYSVEAWVTAANTSQEGPARILTYSQGTGNRNFMLGQVLYNYNFRNRSTALGIDANGTPALQTPDAEEDLQATLQHVVLTFDSVDGRRIYVNGVYTDDMDPNGPGDLVNWHPDYTFVIGDETSDNRQWVGQVRLAAVYSAALNPTQIMQNFQAGAVDKFTLRFGLDTLLADGSYVEFEVSDYDAYSYLFCFPTLFTPDPSGFTVRGLSVAVNGVAPVQSQSFTKASAMVNLSPTQISGLCSVVPKDLGSALDQFSIQFEVLGLNQNIVVEQPPVVPPDNSVAAPLPLVGIRNFDQINNSMAEVTGVDPNSTNVRNTFDELRQALPGTSDVRTFVSAHGVAISKLALEYCDTLVDDTGLRSTFFGPTFDFNAAVPTAFAGQAERDMITQPLVDKMLGQSLAVQPSLAEVQPELDALYDTLTVGCTPQTCDATRTRTVVKGACAAVLSSAAVHID